MFENEKCFFFLFFSLNIVLVILVLNEPALLYYLH